MRQEGQRGVLSYLIDFLMASALLFVVFILAFEHVLEPRWYEAHLSDAVTIKELTSVPVRDYTHARSVPWGEPGNLLHLAGRMCSGLTESSDLEDRGGGQIQLVTLQFHDSVRLKRVLNEFGRHELRPAHFEDLVMLSRLYPSIESLGLRTDATLKLPWLEYYRFEVIALGSSCEWSRSMSTPLRVMSPFLIRQGDPDKEKWAFALTSQDPPVDRPWGPSYVAFLGYRLIE